MPLEIAHKPPLFCVNFTTSPSLASCHRLYISNTAEIQRAKSCMQNIHLSMHFYTTPSISFHKHKQASEYLALLLFSSPKNLPSPCRNAILHISAAPHPSVIQSTNWSHTPTRRHEKHANSFSKTRETECLHSPSSMNAHLQT